MYWTYDGMAPHTRQVVWCRQDQALHFADVYPVLKVDKAPGDIPFLKVGFQNGLTTGLALFEHPDCAERASQFVRDDDILTGPDAARLLSLPAQHNSKQQWQPAIGMLVLAKTPLPGRMEFYPAEIMKAFQGGSHQVRFLCPSNIHFPHLNGDAQPAIDRSNLVVLDQSSALKVSSVGNPRRYSVVHPRKAFGSVTFTDLVLPAEQANAAAAPSQVPATAADVQASVCAADASVQEKREAGWPECECAGCQNCDADSSHRSVQLDLSEMASGLCKECQTFA